jgi:N-methylhydantoinase B/oxoprolinase/acetone carboxylase alpha subunit
MEDDGVTDWRYDIVVTIDKRDDGFTVDFTGTSRRRPRRSTPRSRPPEQRCTPTLLALVDPTLNANAGVFELVNVVAPAGTSSTRRGLRPSSAARSRFQAGSETIIKAFAVVLPDRVSAGGFGSGIICRRDSSIPPRDRNAGTTYEGGQAPPRDPTATMRYLGRWRSISREVWEHKYPCSSTIVAGSGGVRTFRGGPALCTRSGSWPITFRPWRSSSRRAVGHLRR